MLNPWDIDSKPSLEKLTEMGEALEDRSNDQKQLREEVFQHLPDLKGGSLVLDIGSGVGNSTRDLKTRYPECDVHGIEPKQEFVKIAKANYQGLKITYRIGSSYDLPVQDESCDLIYMGTVLEHIHRSDQKSVLSRLRSKLKPGGFLVIFACDFTKHEFGVNDFDPLSLPTRYLCKPSVNQWTSRQAPGWLKETGYNVDSTRFFTVSYDSAYSYAANLINRGVKAMEIDGLVSKELGEELRQEVLRRGEAGTLLITLAYYLGIASKPLKEDS